ncbi:hypothetical protein HWV23_10710 [Natronomonas halophila]|uniref:DUF7521 family protein n=1 Tax=Natronomonas halophila TaxID=2747817 RepID=UPI0015B515BA|nr:hypothetical protein [Natronomonas halophila]QLD86174.1 hypothetical protein HWV23_10710 [Natronomonas halophila]
MTAVFGYTPIQLAVLAFASASAVLGLYIGYLAYRGLRRHDSKQMLVLSVGMILLFGIAYGISIIGTLLLEFRLLALPTQDFFRLGVRVVQFIGLVCIAYSLYIGREARE